MSKYTKVVLSHNSVGSVDMVIKGVSLDEVSMLIAACAESRSPLAKPMRIGIVTEMLNNSKVIHIWGNPNKKG